MKIKTTLLVRSAFLLSCTIASATALGACGSAIKAQAIYTLNFYVPDADEAVQSMTFTAGEKITPPTPMRYGYVFAGWFETYHAKPSAYDSDTPFDFSKGMPAKNLTLYGHWKKEGGSSATEKEVEEYLADLREKSVPNHFYLHYYRYLNTANDYNPWDVWAWPYKPTAGEGTRIDWAGRTTSADRMSATGNALTDRIGGAYIDIDLTATYPSGWDADKKKMLDNPMTFQGSTQIGIQIVQSATRKPVTQEEGDGFWTNDGGNVYLALDEYKMEVTGGTAYHAFVVQDKVYNPSEAPITEIADPFEDDDGSDVTYGDSAYDNVNWNTPSTTPRTAADFKNLGVGYQIMVSSFADSDGDGFGDIYGINQKLDYLKNLGVKALWLTPIQLSDSYHGYDIVDYAKVDPKFGSSASPNSDGEEPTAESAYQDYMDLIEKAHSPEYGMKVVMDLVLNHTSTSNNWFSASANLDPDYRGFYQWGNHNEQTVIKPANSWYPYGDHPYSYYAKFGSGMPELNYAYQPTRDAVIKMSADWVKAGVDGFRLDAVKHIFMEDEQTARSSDTVVFDIDVKNYSSNLSKNLNFFHELKTKVSEQAGRDVFFVGENFDGHAYHVLPYYKAFDSMFDFYSYYNLTSAAATGRTGSTSGFGTAKTWAQEGGSYSLSADQADTKKGVRDGGGIFAAADGKPWGFSSVYKRYNEYRGDASLPGMFTSNHDIARVINRIAGTGNGDGISKQGNVTTGNYADLEKSAMCVKLAELMLPGITWIYYGDEIGMVGNFPEDKDANSDYADLWYRQPMKWVAHGEKGDGSYTTDYYVTGSGQPVESDSVNSSDSVIPATVQETNANSDYSVMAKFAALKNANPAALVTGSFVETCNNNLNGTNQDNSLCFTRSGGGSTYYVVVNFDRNPVSVNGDAAIKGKKVVASYNNSFAVDSTFSASSIPGYSVVVLK